MENEVQAINKEEVNLQQSDIFKGGIKRSASQERVGPSPIQPPMPEPPRQTAWDRLERHTVLAFTL